MKKEPAKLNEAVASKFNFSGSFAVQRVRKEHGGGTIDIRTVTVEKVEDLIKKGHPDFSAKTSKK